MRPVFFFVLAMALRISSADAALSVAGGNLHVSAQNLGGTSAPADKPFVAPSTTATAQLDFFLGAGAAQETVSFTNSQLEINALTVWLNQSPSSATASGTVNLTEDTLEPIWVRVNPGLYGPYYLGDVSLDQVGGGNIFSQSLGLGNTLPKFDFVVNLSPAQYVLTWHDNGHVFLGGGGAGGFDFVMGVPEPGSVSVLEFATAGLLLRRRRS